MGNEYKLHGHTFFPMLCSRTSIKDVAQPKRWNKASSKSISSDPLSPRVGCMGQVKRNNRVSGLPSISHHKLVITSRNNNINNAKYLKLKKLFTGKNILSGNTSPTSMPCAPTRKCSVNAKKMMQEYKYSENGVVMSVIDMDPPLPVIKKGPRVGNNGIGQEGENLWKRRYGGAAGLKTLELQTLQLSRHSSQQLPTLI